MAISNLRRRFAWLAVLPIVLFQLTVAVHQFDHVAEYVESPCQVCIQLDRADDVAPNHVMPVATLAVIGAPIWQAPTSVVVRANIRGFHSRAPPQL